MDYLRLKTPVMPGDSLRSSASPSSGAVRRADHVTAGLHARWRNPRPWYKKKAPRHGTVAIGTAASRQQHCVCRRHEKSSPASVCRHHPNHPVATMVMRYVRTKAHYNSEIDLAGDKLVVITFMCSWNADYKAFDPKLMKITDDYPDVYFIGCDSETGEEVILDLKVEVMPTFWFMRNKKLLDKVEGIDEAKFVALLEKHRKG